MFRKQTRLDRNDFQNYFQTLASDLHICEDADVEDFSSLLSHTLAINCDLRNFLNKAIGIINFAKPFLIFVDDTMI